MERQIKLITLMGLLWLVEAKPLIHDAAVTYTDIDLISEESYPMKAAIRMRRSRIHGQQPDHDFANCGNDQHHHYYGPHPPGPFSAKRYDSSAPPPFAFGHPPFGRGIPNHDPGWRSGWGFNGPPGQNRMFENNLKDMQPPPKAPTFAKKIKPDSTRLPTTNKRASTTPPTAMSTSIMRSTRQPVTSSTIETVNILPAATSFITTARPLINPMASSESPVFDIDLRIGA